jgi:hypothetical protein
VAQKSVMSAYRATSFGVIFHDEMIDFDISRGYSSNMTMFSLLCLAYGPDSSNRYLTPACCVLVQKITYPGSLHPMKAIRVIIHE